MAYQADKGKCGRYHRLSECAIADADAAHSVSHWRLPVHYLSHIDCTAHCPRRDDRHLSLPALEQCTFPLEEHSFTTVRAMLKKISTVYLVLRCLLTFTFNSKHRRTLGHATFSAIYLLFGRNYCPFNKFFFVACLK